MIPTPPAEAAGHVRVCVQKLSSSVRVPIAADVKIARTETIAAAAPDK
jgi:hypothetical protein